MSPTGAQVLVRGLEQAGVEVVFGLPGVHNLAAWEALRESPIRLVGVRHEQAAVYAADGYARATGWLGVALVTTGPGAANTLGATGEAWASGSPVLVIATDIPTTLRRPGVHRGSLHECTDQAGMFEPVTKRTRVVTDGPGIGLDVAVAAGTALAAPQRPVYLEVPTDLLGAPSEAAIELAEWRDGEIEADSALPYLERAQRPLVWAGGGALRADAGGAVAALAERLAAPILTTHSARGLVGDHPLAVGLPPHLREAGALWDEADLVVAIGSDLDGMMTQNWRMARPRALVAVNVDPDDAAKNYAPDSIVTGDARIATERLVAELDGEHTPWADLPGIRAAARERLEREFPAETAFLDAFAAAVPDDAVVLADMCIPGYWLSGFHRVAAPRHLQYPMGWGTLGYAFPASLGAACAGAGPVVSVSGDGGFLFACGELATIAQERLPLTAVIVDDGGYGMLRYDQAKHGAAAYGVDLRTPDFAAMAESFGVRAETVDGLTAAFSEALTRHVRDPEPSVLVARAALEPPPTTSPRWYRAAG